MLGARGLRSYVGCIDGQPVATGAGVALDEGAMVLNVSTLAEHRRRGIGAAVTARALRDVRDAGVAYAFLFASPAGYGVYERLGFRTVERWTVWVNPG